MNETWLAVAAILLLLALGALLRLLAFPARADRLVAADTAITLAAAAIPALAVGTGSLLVLLLGIPLVLGACLAIAGLAASPREGTA